MHYLKGLKGFTLAEVLITLGIIGVVAALTMPSLIQKNRNKVLETQFKTAYSIIARATYQMYMENEGDLSFFNNATFGQESSARNKYVSLVPKYYKVISKPNNSEFENIKMYTANNFVYNYTNDFLQYASGTFILNNGMLFSHSISWKGTEKRDFISVHWDTNGPYKGPNRYGYDLFIFVIGKNGRIDIEGTCENCKNCEFKSTLNRNTTGKGCFYYALQDISPYAYKKSYWKNLP